MTKLLRKKTLYRRKYRPGVKGRMRPYRRVDGDHTSHRFKPRFIGNTKNAITPAFSTRLTYSENYNISTDGVGIYWHVFRLNGLYDPDVSFGGHQPYMYDQLKALYGKWTVTGCKLNIIGRWRTNDINTNPIIGNIILTAGNTATIVLPTSVGNAREQQLSAVYTNADTEVVRVSKYYDIGKVLGIPRNRVLSEDNLSGTISADPLTQAQVFIGMVNQNMGYATNFQGTITLTYYVRFHDPMTVLPS